MHAWGRERDDSLRLSVVMPVYNERPFAEMSIRRVREISLSVEIICVDDGSKDGTRDILQALKEEGVIDHLILADQTYYSMTESGHIHPRRSE